MKQLKLTFILTLILKNFTLFAYEVYVTVPFENSVYVIDTSLGSIGSISVGQNPESLAISPDGAFVYVTNKKSGTVSVISTSEKEVVETINLNTSSNEFLLGITVSPDGSFVYVVIKTSGNGRVAVIDIKNGNAITSFDVGKAPQDIVISPDGAFVYVTNRNDHTVSVYDTKQEIVTATVNVGNNPIGIAISPDGAFVYVTNNGDDNVSVYDTKNKGVISTINVQNLPRAIVALNNTNVYVANGGDSSVSVIDPSGVKSEVLISDIIGPFDIAISPDRGYVYVATQGWINNEYFGVAEISTSTNEITNIFKVGAITHGVVVKPNTSISVTGIAQKNVFLSQSDLINVLQWTAPASVTVAQYVIMRNGQEIAAIAGNNLSFEDHNCERNRLYVYTIIAKGGTGGIIAQREISLMSLK